MTRVEQLFPSCSAGLGLGCPLGQHQDTAQILPPARACSHLTLLDPAQDRRAWGCARPGVPIGSWAPQGASEMRNKSPLYPSPLPWAIGALGAGPAGAMPPVPVHGGW